MRIGTLIPDADPPRVFRDLYQELKAYHQVEVFEFRQFKSPIFYYRIDRFLRRYDFTKFMGRNDVVFFEWASELLAYATHLPKSCKIVTRLHRYEMFSWLPKINWAAVDKVIVLSEAMRQKFISRCPEYGHKVTVIPWAISPNRYQAGPRTFSGNIGTLCEIIPRKRIYELILVFHQLVQHKTYLRLHIAGDTHPDHLDYYDALQSLTKKLALQDKVIFHGRVEPQSWLPEMDIFVSNSYSEGLQSALLEAMASGCYSLSHHWDGANEILPEDHLFFDNKELFEKVVCYCDTSDQVKIEQAKTMRNIVLQKFELPTTLKQIRLAIEEAGETEKS